MREEMDDARLVVDAVDENGDGATREDREDVRDPPADDDSDM